MRKILLPYNTYYEFNCIINDTAKDDLEDLKENVKMTDSLSYMFTKYYDNVAKRKRLLFQRAINYIDNNPSGLQDFVDVLNGNAIFTYTNKEENQ